MTTKTDYPFIRYHGRALGSQQWYIDQEIDKANAENAPAWAVYQRAPGDWSTIDEWTNRGSLTRMLSMAEGEENAEAALALRARIELITP